MKLHDTMKRATDEEQLKLKPLPAHLITTQSEHLVQHYTLLLAALLTAQASISDTQDRLTRLLFDSMQLGDIRAALFEYARELDADTLLEAARLVRDAGLARHLLVDALVLLRLDAPLDDDVVDLVGEFAVFLDVDARSLGVCSRVAADILGIGATRANSAAKQWPGVFEGIRKPIASTPISKVPPTTKPRIKTPADRKAAAPKKAAAAKKPVIKKAVPKKAAAKPAAKPKKATAPKKAAKFGLNPATAWPFPSDRRSR